MDELHAVALEEIALEGKRGCAVSLLWQLLEPRLPAGIPVLTPHLKQHLWQLLRSESSEHTYSTEGLQAEAREAAKQAGPPKKKKKKKKGDEEEDEPPSIVTEIPLSEVPENVSDAEQAGIVLVAPEAARFAVVGVYDELEANHKLSEHQLAVLEMVGQRRHHGAVQTDMANQLGVQHRNFFYVLKMLEARHMIVRNKLMVPVASTANASGWSTTSIVHLPRYAPRVVLGAEAVFKEVQTAQGQQLQQQAVQQQGQSSGNYVVRDDATVMQQICDFLGSQSGRYVSESQVKAVLGFTGSATAHRQWRRLRTRLIKLGCIAAELGMIGEKAISVLRLVKPYKMRLPVVVNSDDDQEEAASDADDEGAADKPTAADEAEQQEAEGEEGAEGGPAAGASKLPVEVGREQLLLEIICEAGPDGLLTPELSKRMGVAPKVLLRSLPELCKKYGVRVEYDMPNKALTNRLIAPQHLLDKYQQQKHLLGMTPAVTAQSSQLQGAGSTAQHELPAPSQQEQAADAPEGAAAVQHQGSTVAAAPAESAAHTSAAEEQAGNPQLHQEKSAEKPGKRPKSAATGTGKKRSAAEAAEGTHSTAVAQTADAGDTQEQAQQPAVTASAAASGAADGSMEVDHLDEAIDAALREAAGLPAVPATAKARKHAAAAGAGASMALEEPEVDSSAAGTAAKPVETGPAPAAGGVRAATGKRLAGLSTHQTVAHATGSTAAALARGALYRVRAVTAVAAGSGSQPAVSGDQQTASSAQQPGGEAGTAGDPAAAGAAGFGFWGQGGVSRLQQRRLQVLRDRLQEAGFIMKQELRRLIMNAEIQPATQQRPHNLYDYTGPDSKTCNRLINSLIECGVAKAVKLQYHQEAVLEPKEVEVFLRADVEQTPELLQRIAVYDAELPGNLRREGMRRALLAQGLVGRAAAAAAAEAGGKEGGKGAFADLGLRVASEQVQLLPVAVNVRSLPGYGGKSTVAGGGRKARAPRGTGRKARKKAAEVAAEAGEEAVAADAGGDAPAAAAAEEANVPAADVAGPAPTDETTKQQPPSVRRAIKGQEIQQLHHNGYIPSLMLRAKLLHQYLCTCVNLKVPPHDDIPQPLGARTQQPTALSSSGYAANSRPGAARHLQFVLAEESPTEEQGTGGLSQQGPAAGGTAEVFQLSKPSRIRNEAADGAAPQGDAAAADTAAGEEPAVAAADEGCQEQTEQLEQQLGGRLLSVNQLWLNMPLAVALSVGGTSLRVLNLLQLVCETSPHPNMASFETAQRDTVFGQRAWKRVVTGLAVLTKLKLVTPAKKGGATSEQSWTQCHPTKATHLVIGTLGIFDEPTQAADVVPARLDFDFTQTGKWGEYWAKMQSLYDTSLFTLAQLERFFPASCVPDVARHRCWVTYRDMSLVPFLRLQARLAGLPVEQLDVHMARQVSEELGLGYTQVHQFVTRLRTDINEQRQKAGLERIYLLKERAGDGAAGDASARRRKAASQRKAERERRRRKHEKRRLKRMRQQQQQDGVSLAGSGTTGVPSGSPSDTESLGDTDLDSEGATAADDEQLAGGAADGLPTRPRKRSDSKAKKHRRKSQQQLEGSVAAAGDSSSALSGSESDVSSGEGRQRHASSYVGRMLPKITIQLNAGDEEQDAAAAAESGAAGGTAAGGSDTWDSDDGRKRRSSLQDTSLAGADSAVAAGEERELTGTEGVPARIAGKRHRWTPQQDRQLLRWVVQQRVEMGTRVQIRWCGATAGLPLRVDLCMRRFNFLKKSKASSKFIASLEAQAVEIHKEYSSRRSTLQQQLARLQQANRLSVNPLLLQQKQPAAADAPAEGAAADQQDHSQQHQQAALQQPLLVPADYEPPLQPLPGAMQQQGSQAAGSGGPGTAAAWLAAAGPHKVTAQGNIILLPTDSIQAKHDKLLDQIEEFVTPRQQQHAYNRERGAAAASRSTADGGPVGLRQQQQRRRRRFGRGSDVDQGDFDADMGAGESDAGISSGESEGEDEWALLTNAAAAGAAIHQRRSTTPGQKRRRGSRQVRPLKTVADRVAHSAALLAAAAAAAAAVIAQRRAAGEQLDKAAEERERQLQLQAYIDGSRKRRSKQRKQHHTSAIANPRDLIQSWRRHHAGVESRPVPNKQQQAGAAAGASEGEKPAEAADVDSQAAAAAAAEGDSPQEGSRELTPVAEAIAAEGPDAAAAEMQDTAADLASPGAAAAAAVPAWPYGPVPTTPVVSAMHLITSLLHLVAEAGSLPADASVALLLRFSQAEVAAAFRWLRALGWMNSGAARRPFQLSTTWNKRLRGEGVLADLLDRAPAAQLALRQLGLLRGQGATGTTVEPDSAAEAAVQQAGEAGTAAEAPVVVTKGDKVSQQLLTGLRQLEADKGRAAALKDKQKDKPAQQKQAKAASNSSGTQQEQGEQPGPVEQQLPAEAAVNAGEGATAMDVEQQGSVREQEPTQQQNTDQPAATAEAKAEAPAGDAAPAANAGATTAAAADEVGAAAEEPPALPTIPKALTNCLSVLHPAAGSVSSYPRQFWVGLQPPAAGSGVAAGVAAAVRPQPVPGGMLLELTLSAAAGRVQLTMCPIAQGSGSSRTVARGEAASLGQKPPQLLVQLEAGAIETDIAAVAAGRAAQDSDDADGALDAAGAGQKLLLLPSTQNSCDAPSAASYMAYCGSSSKEIDDLAVQQPGTSVQTDEAVAQAARKRRREDADTVVVTGDQRQFHAVDVGRDAGVRQQAEQACFAAAAVVTREQDAADSTTSTRPSKRFRTATAEQSASAARSGHGTCPPELVPALLTAVRAAGSLGLSLADLLQQLQQAGIGVDEPDAAASAGEGTDQRHAAAAAVAVPAGQPSAADADTATVQIMDKQPITCAASQAAGHEQRVLENVFAALPENLRRMSGASATAAVTAGLALLQQYGLVRHVPAWQEDVWLSAEDSQRLLAWPLPHQQGRQEQPKQQQQAKPKEHQQQQHGQSEQQEQEQQQQENQDEGSEVDIAAPGPKLTGATRANNISDAPTAAAGKQPTDVPPIAESSEADKAGASSDSSDSEVLVAPWLDHKGRLNPKLWQSLVKRIMGVVLRNPGIPEPLLIGQLDVVSPAAAQEALNILAHEKHLIQKAVAVPGQLVDDSGGRLATEGIGAVATSTNDNAAAKRINAASGGAYGGWGGGAVALRLGAGLTNCTPTPARPPSLLSRKSASGHSVVDGRDTAVQQQQQELVKVQHYWPSLTTGTTCHLTVVPPGCRL